MSDRIRDCFSTAAGTGRKVLIPFITAGDPDPEWTVNIMHALADAGADLIELGVPFSDPTADGPVIQAASERAIRKQVDLARVLTMVESFRRTNDITPVVLMGYLNPLQRFGKNRFPAAAAVAGVDGLLLVDCPPEEHGELDGSGNGSGLDVIRLVAPTTTRERVKAIAAVATGFIYYVSLKGITGAGQLDFEELGRPLKQIREFSALPIAVGFGIKTAEMAAKVSENADAVVIGSALVKVLSNAKTEQQAVSAATAFVAPVREALDNVR